MSSAYLRLLIFLPAILIPACASSSPAFLMMYSAYKLNKQVTIYSLDVLLFRSFHSKNLPFLPYINVWQHHLLSFWTRNSGCTGCLPVLLSLSLISHQTRSTLFPKYLPKHFSFLCSHCNCLDSSSLDLIYGITPTMSSLIVSSASNLSSTFLTEWFHVVIILYFETIKVLH